jgi:CPA2 family monovalent cation:H+ antiporter-2
VVVTFADANAAVRLLSHIHQLNPVVPVIVRARDEGEIARLTQAGAAEVIPEALESGLMLASHTLVMVGVPLSRVMRRVSQVRDEQYRMLRGLFHGTGEAAGEEGGVRLHAITLEPGSHAVGRTLAALGLEPLGIQVRAVRRRGARDKLDAAQAGELRAGDVVVLLGAPEALGRAEELLLRG